MKGRRPYQATSIRAGGRYRVKRRLSRAAPRLVILLLVAGVAINLVPTNATDANGSPDQLDKIAGCAAVDGDTLRCGGERIRLLGIDAPEMPGHCAARRDCAPGDPYASLASLQEALEGELQIERFGTDRYNRTLAMLAATDGDLSCWQLSHGHAIYKSHWDNGMRVARTCPKAALLP